MTGTFPRFHLHPSVLLVLGGVAVAYLCLIRFVGPRRVAPGERVASRKQVGLFLTGVGVLLLGASWPLHDLAERAWYSAHMLQHLLFSLVAAPLLILGSPDWLLRGFLRPIMPVARVLLRPLGAFITFNVVLIASHWPLIVNYTVVHEWAHFLAHFVLVLAALVMWWPVLSPLAELPRLSSPSRMLYLFLQSIIPTVPASFLTFGSTPLYHVYETFPRLYGLSALNDQLLAGLIMKIVGGFYLWLWIAVIFFRWYGAEEKGQPDVAEWQAMERELNARTRAKR